MRENIPEDRELKGIFGGVSEDLVAWIVQDKDAQVRLAHPTPEHPRAAEGLLYHVNVLGSSPLLHLLFRQKYDDQGMHLMWASNISATCTHRCPVWSCVVYLTGEDRADRAHYGEVVTGHHVICRFDCSTVKLWEIPTEEFFRMGRRGLLPLLPLTREGRRRDVVERAIALLTPEGEEPAGELLSLLYGFASVAFAGDDQCWLQRRFAMFYDMFSETPAFQEMAREGRRAGFREGLQQGCVHLRQAAADLVAARFASPGLAEQVPHALEGVDDPHKLQRLVVALACATTPAEVRHLIEDPGALS